MMPVTDSLVSSAKQRETLVHVSKLAEYAERYEDMAKFMKQLVELSEGKISTEERNLLSVAYKQVVTALRNAFRTISSVERTEAGNLSTVKKEILGEYRDQIKKEVSELCAEAVELLEKYLIDKADDVESKIFFLKMKGDYCRYIAEVTDADTVKEIMERSRRAYQEAFGIAVQKMTATNPIRLGLALNFSVFHYEIAKATREAIDLAKKSFDEAVVELENLSEDAYKDSTCIMQLLRDNLTLWNNADGGGGEDQPSEEGTEPQILTNSTESFVGETASKDSVVDTQGGAGPIAVDSNTAASDATKKDDKAKSPQPIEMQDA